MNLSSMWTEFDTKKKHETHETQKTFNNIYSIYINTHSHGTSIFLLLLLSMAIR